MPRLILFAPCERVLIDQENGLSLIQVIQGLKVKAVLASDLASANIPPTTQILNRWQILSVWFRLAGEEGKRFEQSCELILPDGRSFPTRTVFTLDKKVQRVTLSTLGFPIAKTTGDYFLRLSVREADGDHDWQQVAEYPISIEFEESADPN